MRAIDSSNTTVETPCPCHRYRDVNAIYESLKSRKATDEVINWFSGRFDTDRQTTRSSFRRLTCTPSDRCGNRVNASFSILNDIRSACREYLEVPNHAALNSLASATYESSFPALQNNTTKNNTSAKPASNPNSLIARKKQTSDKNQQAFSSSSSFAEQTKPIRRIRPALTPSLGDVGNIAKLPSNDPLPLNSLAPHKESIKTVNQKRSSQSLHAVTVVPTSSLERAGGVQSRNLRNNEGIPPFHGPRVDSANPTALLGLEDVKLNVLNLQSNPLPSFVVDSKPISQKHGYKERNSLVSTHQTSQMKSSSPEVSSYQTTSWGQIKGTISTNPILNTDIPANLPQSWGRTKGTISTNPLLKTDMPAGLPHEQIDHLASIYSSLISLNLVPSTPLELHLLIELLAIDDSAERQPSIHAIYKVLVSPVACRTFAIHALTNLRPLLQNLHLHILSAFVNCPPVQELLPELAGELAARLRERQDNLVIGDSVFGAGVTQAILTIPFDENRDSRHKYKSKEAMALYRNREESRDAFHYQLRFFQNMRGRVLDTSELESSLLKIRRSAVQVVRGVQGPNMHWFAQLFSHLLIQIGLVPMEETDKELLKITDKDKLQRLHKRFSAKVVATKGSSIKALSEIDHSLSPEKEVHQYFPGHQEFFFLFIQAADSYSFGVHLKSRLIATIKSMEKHQELKGFQERIMKQQLLAKFLGVLLFSPNWHKSAISSVLNSVSHEEIDIWMNTTESLLLPLEDLIDEAANKQSFLFTIPWILELLRMAKWDAISMLSTPLQAIFAKLMSVRDSICENQTPNRQFVLFCLESFFHQVLGLRLTHAMPRHELSNEKAAKDANVIDAHELLLSNGFLFASISHMDDFLSLLNSMATSKSKSVGTPRKMRPSIVSTSVNSFLPLDANDDNVSLMDLKSQGVEVQSSDSKGLMVVKLVDLFFHQHSDLKEIGEFIADRAVVKALYEVEQHLLLKLLSKLDKNSSTDEDSFTLNDMTTETESSALDLFEMTLESTIKEAMTVLSPRSTATRVVEIASDLTYHHAKRSSSAKVRSLIKMKIKKHLDVPTSRRMQEPEAYAPSG